MAIGGRFFVLCSSRDFDFIDSRLHFIIDEEGISCQVAKKVSKRVEADNRKSLGIRCPRRRRVRAGLEGLLRCDSGKRKTLLDLVRRPMSWIVCRSLKHEVTQKCFMESHPRVSQGRFDLGIYYGRRMCYMLHGNGKRCLRRRAGCEVSFYPRLLKFSHSSNTPQPTAGKRPSRSSTGL